MTTRSQAQNQILAADDEGLAFHALAAALPKDAGGEAPEWITVFPTLGPIETRDGRTYHIAASALLSAFQADGIELPIDVNHATDTATLSGGRSDAVGWVTDLREREGRLEARVEWLDEGKELLAARKYRYVSPSFFRDNERRATRLKAVALVTSPALAGQPALAGARAPKEPAMKSIATTLGLAEDANEAACLSSLTARLADSIPRNVHEATLTQLNTVSTELAELKAADRKGKVDGIIEAALAAKKITPAEKDSFVELCATDAGLATVEKLLAARTPVLTPSSLDKKAPEQGDKPQNAEQLATAARKIQDDEFAAGRSISFADAMARATAA
ncbi:phage protease [Chelatococcus sp.]|uniref:phage protease n=1 Tax=Chelatococcus sp. TaxID=1953771 RepID=UPI001EBDBFF9|nr:phage protease [Chelatococcus sp.]MBX3545582.1 hypothetical protein [Chelatococcus sp.]